MSDPSQPPQPTGDLPETQADPAAGEGAKQEQRSTQRMLLIRDKAVWLIFSAFLLALAIQVPSYVGIHREAESNRERTQMLYRIQPIIEAIDTCREDEGENVIPESFDELLKQCPIKKMPLNIYTGQPMRCIPLADAPSPGDFTYLRADLTIPYSDRRVTLPCGYYLIVYGTKNHRMSQARLKSCEWLIGSYAVEACRQFNVVCLYWGRTVEQDVNADIQPLSELMLHEQQLSNTR